MTSDLILPIYNPYRWIREKITTKLKKPDCLCVLEYLSRCGRLTLLELISIEAPRVADKFPTIGVYIQ
jgi:hypothetical protein